MVVRICALIGAKKLFHYFAERKQQTTNKPNIEKKWKTDLTWFD